MPLFTSCLCLFLPFLPQKSRISFCVCLYLHVGRFFSPIFGAKQEFLHSNAARGIWHFLLLKTSLACSPKIKFCVTVLMYWFISIFSDQEQTLKMNQFSCWTHRKNKFLKLYVHFGGTSSLWWDTSNTLGLVQLFCSDMCSINLQVLPTSKIMNELLPLIFVLYFLSVYLFTVSKIMISVASSVPKFVANVLPIQLSRMLWSLFAILNHCIIATLMTFFWVNRLNYF